MIQFFTRWLTLLIFISGPALEGKVRFGDFTIAAEKTVDLYRAVGVREFNEVMTSKAFRAGGNSMSSRQFALKLEEAIKYTDADPSKVAILKATVPESVLQSFHFSKTIDPFIFKSGVITVYPENLTLLNQSLRALEHTF